MLPAMGKVRTQRSDGNVALRWCGIWPLIGCLHDRAHIEQLARRSMVISMLIKRAGRL